MLQITNHLTLRSIQANNWTHDEQDREITTCWALYFDFFGHEGFLALITDDGIKNDYANFAMVESEEGDLHESFSETIDENWEKIVEAVKKWETENFKEQTSIQVQ